MKDLYENLENIQFLSEEVMTKMVEYYREKIQHEKFDKNN